MYVSFFRIPFKTKTSRHIILGHVAGAYAMTVVAAAYHRKDADLFRFLYPVDAPCHEELSHAAPATSRAKKHHQHVMFLGADSRAAAYVLCLHASLYRFHPLGGAWRWEEAGAATSSYSYEQRCPHRHSFLSVLVVWSRRLTPACYASSVIPRIAPLTLVLLKAFNFIQSYNAGMLIGIKIILKIFIHWCVFWDWLFNSFCEILIMYIHQLDL